MKRIVYVIELDMPEWMDKDHYPINEMFRDSLETWSTYSPQEGDDPIRVNISYEGVEEI